MPRARHKRSFILHFTSEGGKEAEDLWTGRLQEVESGQNFSFRTLESLIEKLSGFDISMHHRKSRTALCSTCVDACHIGKEVS